MDRKGDAEKIFIAGVRGVLPEKIITSHLKLDGPILKVNDHSFDTRNIENIYVIGAGKASAAMAHYAESILGDRIAGGHVVVKYGHSCKLRKIEVTEAGHPIPDSNGFLATRRILEIANQATERDLVLCLISGGGSALMADLPEGLIPEELYIVNNLLIRCGASINEINCIRKHLSAVKGGQLARAVWPATIVSLILSDVTGNPLDVIASGPTVPDESTFVETLEIIEKYGLAKDLTVGIVKYLNEGREGLRAETPKPGDPVFSKTINILAGTNITALEASKGFAADLGYNASVIDSEKYGDVESVAASIIETARQYKNDDCIRKPACLLFGGEPTLKVQGQGLGGRNQHLALLAAVRLAGEPGITFLSAGTDGTDGPTDAAGAVADSETVKTAFSLKMDPEKYISDFDSYNFFRAEGGHIITGPTFTNVMDLIVVLVV